MTIEQIDLAARKVVLGTTFLATLDGVKRFPKHISLFTTVRKPELLARLEGLQVGDEVTATVITEWPAAENILEDITG